VRPVLAAFDFDGTLTTRDSLPDFIRFAFGWRGLAAALPGLIPVLAGHYLNLTDPSAAKEKIFGRFLAGLPAVKFAALTRAYAATRVPQILLPAAAARLQRHLDAGDRVLIVSASPRAWIEPWARTLGDIDVLATELEIRDGVLTGRYASPNCTGPEKVRRIRAAVPDWERYEIHAYGDSHGDRPMLDMAQHAYYRRFD
jgi:HAD superfamily hydrolase (TIGR01490 family)